MSVQSVIHHNNVHILKALRFIILRRIKQINIALPVDHSRFFCVVVYLIKAMQLHPIIDRQISLFIWPEAGKHLGIVGCHFPDAFQHGGNAFSPEAEIICLPQRYSCVRSQKQQDKQQIYRSPFPGKRLPL